MDVDDRHGVFFFAGGHLIRSVSWTQRNAALSSAEAELYAMVHGGSEGLGARAMGRVFGLTSTPHLYVDASAAVGAAQRKDVGKVRHLDTQSLWIQVELRERRFQLNKVQGTENPGDMMTNALDSKTLETLVGKIGMVHMEGRASIAPKLTTDYGGDPAGGGDGGEGPGWR